MTISKLRLIGFALVLALTPWLSAGTGYLVPSDLGVSGWQVVSDAPATGPSYPNVVARAAGNRPNDPFYPHQLQLEIHSASAVWEQQSGAEGVVVAILDTGIQMSGTNFTHPDLVDNIEPAEAYDYIAGLRSSDDPNFVLLYDRTALHSRGGHVLFVDGRVSWKDRRNITALVAATVEKARKLPDRKIQVIRAADSQVDSK